MAQFVTHIQPTLMEASHHHGPHHHKDLHKESQKLKEYHKDTLSHHKMHHDDLEGHLKDAQRHQGHPRDFPVLPKDHHGPHHDEYTKGYPKTDLGHYSKGHYNGQLKESRSHSEDSGLYIDSHGIPHSYQLHFIDAQGIYRDAEGHAIDLEHMQFRESHHKIKNGHSKEKEGHSKEKNGAHKEKDVHRKTSTEIPLKDIDEKSQHSHYRGIIDKEGHSRPIPPQYIDLHPISTENKGVSNLFSYLDVV